jgi:hypothetical protein
MPKPRDALFVEKPVEPRWALLLWGSRAISLLLFAALAYTALNLKEIYDERAYLRAFEHAANVWPSLDRDPTWTLPPTYLWLNVPLLEAPGGAIFWGRLISLGCYAACLASCLLTRQRQRLGAFHVWLNPWILAYAVRAHPLLPALAILWFCWLWRQRGSRASVAGLLPTSNLLPFLAGTSLTWGLVGEHDWRKAWRSTLLAWVCAVAGLALTWLLIGGFYSHEVLHSAYYAKWFEGKPRNWGYFLYAPILCGPYLTLLGRFSARSLWQGAAMAAACLAYGLLAFDDTGLSAGIFLRVGDVPDVLTRIPHFIVLAIIAAHGLAIVGWARCHRDGVALLAGVVAASVLLCAVPFYWERLATYGVIGPLLIWASRCEERALTRPWLGFAFDLASIALGFWCIANPMD